MIPLNIGCSKWLRTVIAMNREAWGFRIIIVEFIVVEYIRCSHFSRAALFKVSTNYHGFIVGGQ